MIPPVIGSRERHGSRGQGRDPEVNVVFIEDCLLATQIRKKMEDENTLARDNSNGVGVERTRILVWYK